MSNQHDLPRPNPNDIPTIAPGTYGAQQSVPSSPIHPVAHPSSPAYRSHGGQSFSRQSQSGELTVGSYLGPYLLQGELGRGGMGVVYRALDQQLRRVVALKVLIAGEDASDMAVARFQLEAEAVAKLGQHPNIVPVFDIGRQGRLQYFSMEFVEGRPLDQLIAGAEITPKRAATLTLGICQGLARAHDQGILHRDIKPANILIDKQGIPKITDFGLAKDLDEDSGLTQSGVTMGSPLYMSPEQANGETELIDQRSDMYSMGVALYEMLTGTPPFQGKTTLALIQKILMEEPEDPRSRNPSIDVDLASICLKCMEKERERRYQSVGEIIDDLQAYLEGRPVSAKPVTRRRRLTLWVRRNRATALMSAVASLALIAALGTTVWFTWVKDIMEQRAAEQYKQETRLALNDALQSHLTTLQADMSKEAKRASLKESFRRENVAKELRRLTALDQSELAQALLNESLKNYRAEPYLSQIAYFEKKWSRAYRYDPNGFWGLQAQVEIALSFNKKRQFERSQDILQKVLAQLPVFKGKEGAEKKYDLKATELSALEGLAVAFQNLGDFAQLRAVLGRIQTLRDGQKSQASKRLNSLLNAIGEQRQELSLGRKLPGGVGYEHFELIVLDRPILILANRQSRPAFIIEDGQLKRLTDSPLKNIPDGDYIERLRVGDFNGDGKKDIAAAVYRAGQSGLMILENIDGEWKSTFTRIDANARPYDLITGDFDGDKKDEAFLVLKWEAGFHYFFDFHRQFQFMRVQLEPKNSTFICGGKAFDLDKDGHDELILGRPPQIGGKIEVYRVSSLRADQFAPRFSKIQSLPLGGARSFAIDEEGLIATTISIPKNISDDRGLVASNGLSLLRWNGKLQPVQHHPFGYQHHGTMSDMGAVHLGRFSGKRVFAWRSKLYKKDADSKSVYRGVKIQFLIGDDLAQPLAISHLPGLVEIALLDLDGDEDTELLILRQRSDGHATVHVHGRPKTPPGKVQTSIQSANQQTPNEVLLRAAGDLVDFNDRTSLEEAYKLSETLAGGDKSGALGDRARKLMAQSQLRLGEAFEDLAEARFKGRSYQVYPDTKSLATNKMKDLREDWTKAAELTKKAEYHYRKAVEDALSGGETSLDTDLKDSILLVGREAARRLLDWNQYQKFNQRLSARSLNKVAEAKLARLVSLGTKSSVAYEGSFADPKLPLRIDFPFRAKFTPSKERGPSKKVLEAVLDNHSRRSYIGVPVLYKGDAFQFELDLDIGVSPWELSLYFGLLPEQSTMRPEFDPENEVLLSHFRQPGALRYRPQMTSPLSKADVRVLVQGVGRAKPILKSETGQWTFRYLYSPETETVSLTVYDRYYKQVIYRYRSRIQRQLRPGRYLFGLSMGYIHETTLRGNPVNPTMSQVRLGSFRLSGPRLNLDRAPSKKVRGLVQEAGAAVVRGQNAKAIALYQQALERDPSEVLASLHLAVHTKSVEPLRRALESHPFLLALSLDDAFRGSHPEAKRTLGQLLQSLRGDYPGFCASFLGDLREAQAALAENNLLHRYLRLRSKTKTFSSDLKWFRDRRMRHSGTELQEIFWAPSPKSREPGVNAIANALRSRKDLATVFQCWIHLSRRLILHPKDTDALLLRANAAMTLKEYGRAFNDLRRRCELKPRDWSVWRDLAYKLVQVGSFHETLEALEEAMKNGAPRELLNQELFQDLSENPRYLALKRGS